MKIAVVTGSHGGIGTVICRKLISNGWHIIGIDTATSKSSIKSENYNSISCDLAITDSIERAANKINSRFSHVNLLLNCAAKQHVSELLTMSDKVWDQTMNINVKSAWILTKLLQDGLKEGASTSVGASIINISSIHAIATSKGMSAYAASKAALVSMTRSLSIELSDQNIRANSITPGAVATPMLFEHLNKRQINKLLSKQLIRELIPPDSIADLVLFLTSKSATNITGQDFIIDSGVLPQLLTEV